MGLLSIFRRTSSAQRRDAARNLFLRIRRFESLESRELLDAAGAWQTLPETITIATPDTYHYAIEGTDFEMIDSSSVDGLTASFPVGQQVALTIMKTTTDGVITSLGDVVIQLFGAEGEAPNSTEHFLNLIYDDYYEGRSIHRIISGFMFQGGSEDGAGHGGSGLSIANEISDVLTHSRRGTVAYANSGPNTSDAQFYVTFEPTRWLDGGYNVFGYVVDGYDVVEQLEAAEVVANSSGELALPVDSYTITNARVLDSADVSNGVLRLTATDSANGATTISYSSVDENGDTKFNQTTAYVGATGLEAYVQDALNNINFEITAGESVNVSLPTEFGGSAITYTVTANDDAVGYAISSADSRNANFTITTENYGAQLLNLSITATVSSTLKADLTQYVFVSPVAPTLEFADSEAVVKSGDSYYVKSDFADPQISFKLTTYDADEAITLDKPFVAVLDGTDVLYTVAAREYDAESKTSSYVITLEVEDPIENGAHVLSIQRALPIDRVSDYNALLSDAAILNFTVDADELEIVDAPSSITIYVGQNGSQTFLTNKTADGANRSDVAFTLDASDAAKEFLSLSENGVLSWSDVEAIDAGTYDVAVKATDALGNEAAANLKITVGGAPVFSDLTVTTATAGQAYAATVSASDTLDSTIPMRYELVGDSYPEGFSLDSETGAVSWNIPEDYLPTTVKTQTFSFTVKATERVGSGDDVVDGLTAEKTFEISITNPAFNDEIEDEPIWDEPTDQTVVAGEVFTYTVHAELPEPEIGVKYELIGEYPEGMTINESTGAIAWASSADYFTDDSIRKTSITINVRGTAVISTQGANVNYGGSSEESFKLTITNPNYADQAPVFDPIDNVAASTGQLYTAKITAKDPNGEASEIKYELVGEGYPEGFDFDEFVGVVTWDVPEDYLAASESVQAFRFKIRATEIYATEEGDETEGLSTEQEFEIMIANSAVDTETLVAPTYGEIASATVKTGETLTTTVAATLPESAPEGATIQYDLVGDAGTDYPEGLTINSETGEVSWSVPSDYLTSDASNPSEITVSVQARTVLSASDVATTYGGSATAELKIKVEQGETEKPDPTYNSWQDWFNAWLDAAQERYDSHSTNLAKYLTSYLEAVDARNASMKEAAEEYSKGDSSLSELIGKRQEAQETFEGAVADARKELDAADAKTESDYAKTVETLNDAYKDLKETDATIPADADKQIADADNTAKDASTDKNTGNSNFRFVNKATSAVAATNLSDILKMWRSGYSKSSIYHDVYSDPGFVASVSDETPDSGSGTDSETNAGTGSGTNAGSGDDAESGANAGSDTTTDSGTNAGASDADQGSTADAGAAEGEEGGSSVVATGDGESDEDEGALSAALLALDDAEFFSILNLD